MNALEELKHILEERQQNHKSYSEIARRTCALKNIVMDLETLNDPIIQNAFAMICFKLARASMTPYNKDHWLDIAGYALLTAEDLPKDDE
ncbi:hypothetical protein AB832_07580 [Flavobacteriaceae bacterium (ex Bugula neritina AB1)]|nr:hypothetical protein AB832_07580 [Flavobacteriaceae bacterium (ex Bugula neritina AB1)]